MIECASDISGKLRHHVRIDTIAGIPQPENINFVIRVRGAFPARKKQQANCCMCDEIIDIGDAYVVQDDEDRTRYYCLKCVKINVFEETAFLNVERVP